VEQHEANASVTVFQERSWFGDPRLGAFVLSIDGKRAGVVRLQDSLTVAIQPGPHTFRIRQWWYQSPAVNLDVSLDHSMRLKADIDRSLSAFRLWLRFLFTPWKALTLTPFT
jgi:hypothetical protein